MGLCFTKKRKKNWMWVRRAGWIGCHLYTRMAVVMAFCMRWSGWLSVEGKYTSLAAKEAAP